MIEASSVEAYAVELGDGEVKSKEQAWIWRKNGDMTRAG